MVYQDHSDKSLTKPFSLDDAKQVKYCTVLNILILTYSNLKTFFKDRDGWETGEREILCVCMCDKLNLFSHVFHNWLISSIYLFFECFQLHLLIRWTGNFTTCISFEMHRLSFLQISKVHLLHKWLPQFEISNLSSLSFSASVVVSFSASVLGIFFVSTHLNEITSKSLWFKVFQRFLLFENF